MAMVTKFARVFFSCWAGRSFQSGLAPAARYLVQRARAPQLPVSDAGVVGDHAVTVAVLLEVLAPDAAPQADSAGVLFGPLLAKASASTAIPAAASVLR